MLSCFLRCVSPGERLVAFVGNWRDHPGVWAVCEFGFRDRA